MILKPLEYPHECDTEAKLQKAEEADEKQIPKRFPHRGVVRSILNFISNPPPITKPDEGHHGISGLKLCILFEHRSPDPVPDDLGQPNARPGPYEKVFPF